jgi:DNA mismatch repair ATPase MutS
MLVSAQDSASPNFVSILFEGERPAKEDSPAQPAFFRDLNLDQIVDAITAGRDEYDLKPFFHVPLRTLDAINYRHEIMSELENGELAETVRSFSCQMRTARGYLTAAEKLSYQYERERWLVKAVETYGAAVEELSREFNARELRARGLIAFRAYLARYAETVAFRRLLDEAKKLTSDLSAIRYSLLINGNQIVVRPYNSEADYSAIVEETFAKFRQGAVKNYEFKLPAFSGMNHVEAQVLELVAKLNPEVFRALDEYFTQNADFVDPTIADFNREIQFYIAYLEYAERFKRSGLQFCYPGVSDKSKGVSSDNGFDLALAGRLIPENLPVVCNDFFLSGAERIFVVSGPNQGGKTTFARTFGQLHYLASLGCPVPGATARLFLFDRLLTHFEREEDIATLRGKLQDDLIRIHETLEQATPNSIVILNEIFSSTTLQDAVYLSGKIVERLTGLDALAVCVTFLDELSSLNEKTVSVVAAVVPDNPTERTFKLERRPADGLSYALALAEKHRLTYRSLKERLER